MDVGAILVETVIVSHNVVMWGEVRDGIPEETAPCDIDSRDQSAPEVASD